MPAMHIVVGMSGGVDSSVAAATLLAQGHRVTGLFMKNWEEDDDEKYCAAAADLADAEEVCKQLGIKLRTINFAHEYWERVFRRFLSEYQNGRTPNPDVLCNREIKFKEFLDWAIHLGAARIATGHYARLATPPNQTTPTPRCQLRKARDPIKDQSYFLHSVEQTALRKAHFPLGEMLKSEVRKRARELGLATHDKKDSTGICFIGERRFQDFLARFLPARPGKIKTLHGETIGAHGGAHYYTIGQRRGLGIGGTTDPTPTKPNKTPTQPTDHAWYVADKDITNNILYVVQGRTHNALHKRVVFAENLHWISGRTPTPPTLTNLAAQTRYRQQAESCVIAELDARRARARVEFTQPQWAVAPGQSIVFYRRDICLGGGIIRAAA